MLLTLKGKEHGFVPPPHYHWLIPLASKHKLNCTFITLIFKGVSSKLTLNT